MPTYDYRCKNCGHEFEEFQSISADPLTTCEVCGGELNRVISGGTGLIFKGSGFYITDYREKKDASSGNGKAGDKEKDTSEDKKTTDQKAEKKTDTKKETSTDPKK